MKLQNFLLFGIFWIFLDRKKMEAAGIEPELICMILQEIQKK